MSKYENARSYCYVNAKVELLFQTGILIPDIFCFISNGLLRHVRRAGSKISLFEAGIANGFIRPAFREPRISTFEDALKVVDGRANRSVPIRGLLDNPKDREGIAVRLDAAAKSNSKFRPQYWPKESVGERFDTLVENFLVRPKSPPIVTSTSLDQAYVHKYWEMTKRWRTDCIQEARSRTASVPGGGLRRGEIFYVVGKDLGLPTDQPMDDPSQLLRLGETDEQKRAIELFVRWVSECYHLNQAAVFNVASTFPNYDPLGGLMLASALPSTTSTEADLPSCAIQAKIRLPPWKSFLSFRPNDLFAIKAELGFGYLAALEAWQRQPTEHRADEVRRTLKEYADTLTSRVTEEADVRAIVLDVVLGAKVKASKALLTRVLDLAGESLSVWKPVAGPLIQLARLGYAIYLQVRTKEVGVTVGRPNVASEPADLNLALTSYETEKAFGELQGPNDSQADVTSRPKLLNKAESA